MRWILAVIALTLILYAAARILRDKNHPPGPPGSIEYLRWKSTNENKEGS